MPGSEIEVPSVGDMAGRVSIEVRNLTVGALARERLLLGDVASLTSYAKKYAVGIRAIVWNEEGIRLVMDDKGSEVAYLPEFFPETAMFLSREHKRERRDEGNRVWQGEFEPVLFAKKDLVKFLKNHSKGDAKLLESIRELKVTTRHEESETMLDLESDDVRRVEEETEVSNVPRHFSLQMPVTEDIDSTFEFEASIYRPEDPYERRAEAKTKRIAVRAVNARPVLRAVVESVMARLPKEIPRYYGAFRFVDPEGRR